MTASVDRPAGEVGSALFDALAEGRREAARLAIADLLEDADEDAPLLPLWNELTSQDVPEHLTIGDLLGAVRLASGHDPFDT